MSARLGTTLLELIVALVVTAAVAAIGAGTFQQVTERRRTLLQATRETERAAALRAQLSEWLLVGSIELPADNRRLDSTAAAVQALAGDRRDRAESRAALPALGAGDDLYFTTTALTPDGTAKPRLRLYVDIDPATPERGLTLESQREPAGDRTRWELDANIERLTTEYLDPITRRWVPARDALAFAPVAVRLLLPAGEARGARLWELPLSFPMGVQADTLSAAEPGT